jgi:hypothetical protein
VSESLAHALQGKLTYDTASWDKLTALAWGSVTNAQRSARESLQNSLGVSLLGFKVAQRPDLFARAASELQRFLGHVVRVGLENRGKVARAAIREWVIDMCPKCCGTGSIFDTLGVKKVCGECAGTTRRKYTNAEREAELGFSGEKAERAMSAAHFIIATSVGFAVWQARERLKD